MVLSLITSTGDTDALTKVNATINAVNQQDIDIAAEETARIAGDAAVVAVIDTLPFFDIAASRPGDSALIYTNVLTGGNPADLPALDTDRLRYDDAGRVVRYIGNGIIAPRIYYPIEPSRKYLVEFAVQRRVNSPDPDSDAIRCGVAWYDQSYIYLGQQVIEDKLEKTVGDGRMTADAVIGRSAGAGIDFVAHANARYAKPFVQTYGDTVQNDIEVLRWSDITNAAAYSPDLSEVEGRLDALESADAHDRLEVLEAEVTAPNTLRLPVMGDLVAADVPVSVDIIELQGYTDAGDFGAGRYKRTASSPALAYSDDGAGWALAEPLPTPSMYGAFGNGVTDDHIDYQTAQSAVAHLLLPEGMNYNLELTLPTKPVWGPGSLTIDDEVLTGFLPVVDVVQSNVWWAPTNYAEEVLGETSTPGTGISNYFNVVIGAGNQLATDLDTVVFRSTIVGESIGQSIVEWERVDAYGAGAMRFSELANRITAIGTIVFQWGGSRSVEHLEDTYHDWWLASNNGPPGSVGWDFMGMETRNPGIGATIAAWSTWPTTTSHFNQNVGVGRDAGLHLVRGAQNVWVGYQAGGNAFHASNVVAIGNEAGLDGVFHGQLVALGSFAARYWQEGEDNLVAGYFSAPTTVTGDRNTILGAFAYNGLTAISNSVIIGYQAGIGLGDNLNDVLVIQRGSARLPLISGRFDDFVAGVNIAPDDINGTFHIRTGTVATIAANTAADDLIVENGTDAAGGISIMTLSTAIGELNFGDTGDNNPGSVWYDHATDTMLLRAADATKVVIGTASVYTSVAIHVSPGSSVTPVNNGDITFQFTNNTTITFKGKGSDGTVRSGTITLA